MALREELVLEVRDAFRELDALQGRLDRISDIRLDVTADTSGLNSDLERSQRLAQETASTFGEIQEQTVLTTDQYRRAVDALEQGADAAQAVDLALSEAGEEAASAEAALRRVATFLDLSEDEAADLAGEMRESVTTTTALDRDLRQVARSMGLSEEEAAQFTRQMRLASGEAATLDDRTNSLVQGFGRLRGLIIGAVAAFGVRGLVRQFDQAIDSTLALSESINAVNVIFDEGAESVLNFAETAARSAGLAASQAQQLVVPIGASLRNFGFEAEAAGQAAVILAQRASDLASVFNTDVPEALTAIQAALRGETDPIERFGASISAARVEAFALAEGLADSSSEITDAIKVQARYGLILQDTERAAGDFANTSDEAANRQRILAAETENARAALGDALLPAYESLLEVAPDLIASFEDLAPSIASVAESFANLVRDAGPAINFLSDLPRGFGVISDVVGSTGSALFNFGQGLLALGSGGAIGDLADFGDAFSAIGDGIDNIAVRVVEQDIVDFLRAGGDEVDAFANAIDRLNQKDVLSEETIGRFAAITGIDDRGLRQVLGTFLDAGDAAELTAEELEAVRAAFRQVDNTADDADRVLRQYARNPVADEIERQAAAAEAAALRLELLDTTLGDLERISDTTGLSIGEVARNIGLIEPELAPVIDQLGVGVIETEAFNRAFGELATAVRLDFGDAVAEFDLLISKTNEAGDEVPATVAEMLADLQTQADRFARLEIATSILEALGFEALAAELRSQGPDAVDAAEEFVGDIAGAIEAESLLTEGADLGEEALRGFREALSQGDITPELLELAQQFTSGAVQAEILRAAALDGSLFATEFVAEAERILSQTALELNVPINFLRQNVDLGAGGAGLTGGTGGTVTVNQTNNFNTTPVPTTDTQRISQATGSIIRSNFE